MPLARRMVHIEAQLTKHAFNLSRLAYTKTADNLSRVSLIVFNRIFPMTFYISIWPSIDGCLSAPCHLAYWA